MQRWCSDTAALTPWQHWAILSTKAAAHDIFAPFFPILMITMNSRRLSSPWPINATIFSERQGQRWVECSHETLSGMPLNVFMAPDSFTLRYKESLRRCRATTTSARLSLSFSTRTRLIHATLQHSVRNSTMIWLDSLSKWQLYDQQLQTNQ